MQSLTRDINKLQLCCREYRRAVCLSVRGLSVYCLLQVAQLCWHKYDFMLFGMILIVAFISAFTCLVRAAFSSTFGNPYTAALSSIFVAVSAYTALRYIYAMKNNKRCMISIGTCIGAHTGIRFTHDVIWERAEKRLTDEGQAAPS